MLAALAVLQLQSTDCESNYEIFLQKFAKERSEVGMRHFCRNFEWLLEHAASCPNCAVTSVYDRDFSDLVGHVRIPFAPRGARAQDDCQKYICYAEDPLKSLKRGPKSVDLREFGLVTAAKNQASCGSCWAFAAIGGLENSLLLDQKLQTLTAWQLDARTLDLSEHYFLGTIWGFQQYCQGGDSVAALNYMTDSKDKIKTVETELNYPYDYVNGQKQWKDHVQLVPKLAESDYLYPSKTFKRAHISGVVGTEQTQVISLMDDELEFDGEKVQAYLARGVAVIAAMNTKETSHSQSELSSYDGNSVIKGYYCRNVEISDHQVLFVGYGTFKGERVWVVKNSWGADWGNAGCFYVRMGANELCLENYAFAVLPQHYDASDVFTDQKYATPFNLKRGANGLDVDDGEFDEFDFETIDRPSDGLSRVEILLISIGAIVAVGLLAWLIAFLVRKCRAQPSKKHVMYRDIATGPVQEF